MNPDNSLISPDPAAAPRPAPAPPCLVLGVGNSLLGDDGVGIHVTTALRQAVDAAGGEDLRVMDGGTIGLALLPEVEATDALVIVDAAELGEAPGTVRVFEGRDIDRHLSGKRRSVHEVAILDLLAAAELRGSRPARCALVAVQPASTDWALEPTPAVREAVPVACEAILQLTRSWNHEP